MKPETQTLAIECRDGSVAIMHFVTRGLLNPKTVFEREATDDAINAEIQKSGIDALSWQRIDPGDIPNDRTFRSAWKLSGGVVVVDMPKAREIHRDRLREARATKFAALDVEYQRADEKGDAKGKQAVSARKQALRDITADPRIEAAQTPEELNAVWLEPHRRYQISE